ncbi:MAG: prephenate/arogenate dehydrogenase [Synechococcales cyanobacterium RM1_1_8]|nr:prephenate/arogenate dehydrogenase [Synechococcales cyanobacterium RM1_1_8]
MIGGSLGLDLRAAGYGVLGVSRQQATCDRALARGVADSASLELASLAGADVIILCTPLHVLGQTVVQLRPHLRPETVLTDVGSVKGPIVAEIAPLWPNFVGGHPMAGTADQGIEAALSNLFQGRPYVLTPTAQTPELAVERVWAIALALGALPHRCTPEEHDRAVAWISHLPVMVSTSLFQACRQEPSPEVRRLAQQLASSGFRDTSRVGGGNPELGQLMARYNREALLTSLGAYRRSLDQLIAQIEGEDWPGIAQTLAQGQGDRPLFL